MKKWLPTWFYLLVLNVGNGGMIYDNYQSSQQPPATHPFPSFSTSKFREMLFLGWINGSDLDFGRYYLVGGLEHFLFSIIYGMSSFPLTNSCFSRWLKLKTTNQLLIFGWPTISMGKKGWTKKLMNNDRLRRCDLEWWYGGIIPLNIPKWFD